MKETAILLLCAVALAHTAEVRLTKNGQRCNCNPNEAWRICDENWDKDDVLVAHPNCDKFYKCANGRPVVFSCTPGLLYNPYIEDCDWPQNVDCEDRPISGGDGEDEEDCDEESEGGAVEGSNENGGNGGSEDEDCEDTGNGGSDNGDGDNEVIGGGNNNPEEAPAICAAEGSESVLIAHENCNKFYICNGGVPVVVRCYGTLMFNPDIDRCDWPDNVDCGDRIIPDPEEEDGDNGGTGDGGNGDGGNGDGGSGDGGNGDGGNGDGGNGDGGNGDGGNGDGGNGDGGNGDGGNGDSGSGDGGNGDGDNGGGGTCNCNPDEAPSICAADGSDGVLVAHENCNQFYKCDRGEPVVFSCSGTLLYNPYTEQCDWPANVECGDRVIPEPDDNNNGGGDNGGGDNGGGDNGEGDNGNGDNGEDENVGGGNCDPNEAPTICAAEGSEGVLVAHENCNQFYICNGGKPVALTCPGALLFNPNTDRCDWPDNVDCGDRILPDSEEEDSDNGGTGDGGNGDGGNGDGGNGDGGNGDGGNGDGGNGDGGNGDGENGDGGNGDGGNGDGGNEDGGNGDGDNGGGGTCNCHPDEAPLICAADGSDGVLVAHENCNQFYKCDRGEPVVFTCSGTLLYNPYTEQCDWPENVECGDRVISEPDDNNNGGGDNGGGDSGNGDNGEDENVGGGNCDPNEAPTICAAEGSEGVLVAHENCNLFYICNGGKPVALTCPGTLLFNPNTDRCDWPDNVDCGDRIIPDPEDNNNGGGDNGGGDNGGSDNGGGDNGGGENGGGDNGGGGNGGGDNGGGDNGGGDNGGSDNGGGDNGGGDNGGGDNGNNNSTCNCKPEEAPQICSVEENDGVLIAHENCNQFYKCAHGKPVTFSCYGNLLYNPYTEQCDWPENVECGDRIIPDPEDNNNGGGDNGGGDNGGGDNGGGDNGGGDNDGGDNGGGGNGGGDNGEGGNVGGGNCDPNEAPTICAADDSEGVLVAHENCNQFYICNGGKPVALTCPGALLFNPNTDQCDWAYNVDCGDRIIPDPEDNNNGGGDNGGGDNGGGDNGGGDNGGGDNGGGDNGGGDNGGGDNGGGDSGGDNGGGDNGGGDNGNNNSTCNCKPEEAPQICAIADNEGVLIAHENCNQFYKCADGKPVAFSCYGNLLYNPYTEQCDWPSNVVCGDRIIPDPEDNNNGEGDNGGGDNGGGDNGGGDNGGGDNGGGDNGEGGNVGGGNCDPNEAPTICAANDSEGVLVAHENCNQFYICNGGKPVALTCPGTLFFNPNTDQCDWPFNVECGDRVIPDPEDNNNGGGDNGDGDNGGGDNGDGDNGGGDNGGGDNGNNNSTCNCKPEEAPQICAIGENEGVLIAHENCNQFYKCADGKPVAFSCYGNLLYNPYTEHCDWPSNVECGDRIIPDPEDNNNGGGDNGGGDNGGGDNGGGDNGGGDNGGGDNGGGDNGGGDNGGTCNCRPEEAPEICSISGNEGVLVAHENCNQFYKCANGRPEALTCFGTLLYNPYTEQCDWPENVDCGDRVIPDTDDNENGGGDNGGGDNGGGDNGGGDNGGGDNGGVDNGNNNGTCNCNPEEAPKICANGSSNGVLVAHENCNQFYICANNVPVAMTCYGNLLYNPYTERCDWPHNVECGDRVIPEPEEGDSGSGDNGGSGDGDSGSGGGDNGGGDNGGGDNGGGDNGGTCNCRPEEAPEICSISGNEGVLVAHENCNQFYKCANGRPETLTCFGTLLYNPYTEQCDWPENVDCGDRVVPEPDDNENGGGDNGGGDNGGGDNGGGDNGGGDNGGGDNGNNNSTCNCNPEEAPQICAIADNEGVLIAHENCNQFYKCANGRPEALTCFGTLLYNPYTEQCDWPENVVCGNRTIPDTDDNNNGDGGNGDGGNGDGGNGDGGNGDDGNGDGGNGDGGNGDGGNGDGGNGDGDNGDGGNGLDIDDPSQAPSICASPDANGILVAHENCDQYYTCSGGVPVAMNCSGDLLFNTNTQLCDWPRLVDCGDRIVPEADGCLCNPRQAPAICSGTKSDGLKIAHDNCHLFFECAGGVPLERSCSVGLNYNPHKEVCDWPTNVDCEGRTSIYSALNKHVESRQTIRN